MSYDEDKMRVYFTDISRDVPFCNVTLISQAADEAVAEVLRAITCWPRPFSCAHEGISVLREEFEELWDEVKVNQKRRDLDKMRKEAIQVAAMALRFVVEVCDEGRGRE